MGSRKVIMTIDTIFIKEIIEAGQAWSLASDNGWAVSESVDYEDAEVIPFWSSAAKAEAAASDQWKGYKPEAIALAVLLEEWLPGMHYDVTLAGLNWGADRKGAESEPLALAHEIIIALKKSGKQLSFANHTDLSDYENEVKEALKG